jgi:hypothetical protein
MPEWLLGLRDVLEGLLLLLWGLFQALLPLVPVGLWCAWWLWGVNWSKAWPVLARGAWAPVVLLMLVAALVWSRLNPAPCPCLGFVTIPTFWWQLGGVSALVALALLCGWLQGKLGWAPAEVDLNPPPPATGHGHH